MRLNFLCGYSTCLDFYYFHEGLHNSIACVKMDFITDYLYPNWQDYHYNWKTINAIVCTYRILATYVITCTKNILAAALPAQQTVGVITCTAY